MFRTYGESIEGTSRAATVKEGIIWQLIAAAFGTQRALVDAKRGTTETQDMAGSRWLHPTSEQSDEAVGM